MSPPINTPDGSEVSEIVLPDGSTASEVIGPDGNVVFESVPDSVVDNYEDADTAGVYESGDTIETYYTNNGTDSDIQRTTTDVTEGSKAVAIEGHGQVTPSIWSVEGDGLNTYPSEGDTVGFLIRAGSNLSPVALFQVQDSTNPGAYGFKIDAANNLIELSRLDDVSLSNVTNDYTVIDSASVTLSADTWYWGEADLSSSSDSSLAFRISELDTSDNSRGSQLGSASGSDNNYNTATGVGLTTTSGSGANTVMDWMRIL